MKLRSVFFPTQKVTIPKTKQTLELELESIFNEKSNFFAYKEIVTEKLVVKYRRKSFLKTFVICTEIEVRGYENNGFWIVNIQNFNRSENSKYMYLFFPIICTIFYFIFGHFKTILVGFLFGGFHILLNCFLSKLDLIKWKKEF